MTFDNTKRQKYQGQVKILVIIKVDLNVRQLL